MTDFYKKFSQGMSSGLISYQKDNFDYEIRKVRFYKKVIQAFDGVINGLFSYINKSFKFSSFVSNEFYLKNIDSLSKTYDMLNDEQSKDKFVELLLYKILGHTKVKLSLNNEDFWDDRKKIGQLKRSDKIPADFREGYLQLYDLNDIGYDLALYFVSNGIYVDFVLQQYNYKDMVSVEHGDVVIDAGACWGDTALYFASRGAAKVFSFEFVDSNIEIFKKNVSLNPKYKPVINLVESPLWSTSDLRMSYLDLGPGSRVGSEKKYKNKVTTLTIDDLVQRKGLEKVDFIKMDIEGTEADALEGARKTISKFKPKLAISIYHKYDDFIVIPELIKDLNPNYEFYLDYYTIIGDEIMLYAIDKT
jgi:FkbM family methyltransferase